MDRVLIFDVDGTLAQSGQEMDPRFEAFLEAFWHRENCYLVSGSNREKLAAQLPARLLNSAKGVFASSGNEFFVGDQTQYVMEHEFPADLVDYCHRLIELSPFCWRTGAHFDRRPGMLNVSVVGRNADRLDRKRYIDFDKVAGEREYLRNCIMRVFPDYEVSLGGQISVDIVPRGWNKARAYSEISARHPRASITFFCDRMEAGGNDKPLADKLMDAGHRAVSVKDFRETWQILQDEFAIELRLDAVG